MFQLLADTTATSTGLTTEQANSINGAFGQMGSAVLDNFINLLPTIAVITGIAFVIYFVNKKTKTLKKGR